MKDEMTLREVALALRASNISVQLKNEAGRNIHLGKKLDEKHRKFRLKLKVVGMYA